MYNKFVIYKRKLKKLIGCLIPKSIRFCLVVMRLDEGVRIVLKYL